MAGSEAMKLHLSDSGEERGSSVLSSAEIRCLVLVTEESQEGRADLLWAQSQNKSKVVSEFPYVISVIQVTVSGVWEGQVNKPLPIT